MVLRAGLLLGERKTSPSPAQFAVLAITLSNSSSAIPIASRCFCVKNIITSKDKLPYVRYPAFISRAPPRPSAGCRTLLPVLQSGGLHKKSPTESTRGLPRNLHQSAILVPRPGFEPGARARKARMFDRATPPGLDIRGRRALKNLSHNYPPDGALSVSCGTVRIGPHLSLFKHVDQLKDAPARGPRGE